MKHQVGQVIDCFDVVIWVTEGKEQLNKATMGLVDKNIFVRIWKHLALTCQSGSCYDNWRHISWCCPGSSSWHVQRAPPTYPLWSAFPIYPNGGEWDEEGWDSRKGFCWLQRSHSVPFIYFCCFPYLHPAKPLLHVRPWSVNKDSDLKGTMLAGIGIPFRNQITGLFIYGWRSSQSEKLNLNSSFPFFWIGKIWILLSWAWTRNQNPNTPKARLEPDLGWLTAISIDKLFSWYPEIIFSKVKRNWSV